MLTDLVHEPSQSVICPACNAQSPSSVDFLHFQHMCCIHHMEVLAGKCMICSTPQSTAILSDPLVAASSTSTRPLRTQRSILSVFLTTCHFRIPTLVVLLTLNHWTTVGWNGPEFTRLPKVPPLLGSVNGFVGSCGSSTSVQDIPALPTVSCSQCPTRYF